MAKKKIILKKEMLEDVKSSIYGVPDYSLCVDGDEGQIDVKVIEYLKDSCGYDEQFIKGHKTGNRIIDSKFPSPRGKGSGTGAPDVMIYNIYGTNELSIIIEDKAKKASDTKEDTIDQAIVYTTNPELADPCRIVIGNHPDYDLEVRVLVGTRYKPLIINGEQVKGFFGKELLNIIYENPNFNEFILAELVEKPFGQKEFHNMISSLKNLYRQAPEIQNSDETSINFTIAMIALKMIATKINIKWDSMKNVDDILNFLEMIVGDTAKDANIREKYVDVFKMLDNKGKKVVFDFRELISEVKERELEDHRVNGIIDYNFESIIMQVHRTISILPENDIPVDLFGEVYECLANNKTKSDLGEFFTRRHIIKAIVRMFLSEDDIEDIVDNKKLVADPCCGTGGFLTESFKYIKDYYEMKHGNVDEISDLANEIIIGYDINASSIGRTRVNMTLAGDGFSDIKKANTIIAPLSDKPRKNSAEIKKNINFILTNVPYGAGAFIYKDENSEYEFLKNNNIKRLELNFVLKIIDMLKVGGRASIIVPEGLMEAPSFAEFREYLLETCQLETIISLPCAAFAPYTKWKTYVIFLKKRNKNLKSMDEVIAKNEKIWAYIVDNDGYANSDKRFRTALTDEKGVYLHDELSAYLDSNGVLQSSIIEQHFEAKDEDTTELWKNEWGKEIKGKKYGYLSIQEIAREKTVVYPTINIGVLKNKVIAFMSIKDEEYDLSEIEYNNIVSILRRFKKKKPYKVTQKKWKGTKKEPIKLDFKEIFDEMGIDIIENSGKTISELLCNEANKKEKLNDELHCKLLELLDDPDVYFDFTKDEFIELLALDECKENVELLMNALQIEYDENNDSFLDISQSQTIYKLQLVPEKYFRNKQENVISLQDLKNKIEHIEGLLATLNGDGKNENK